MSPRGSPVVLIQFDEHVGLPVDEVYPYFRSPKDWPRLYGTFGGVEDRGDGWFAVPLRRFPFPLVAKTTRDDPNSCVAWTFRGFWRGDGQVSFVPVSDGVIIRGHERLSIRYLPWVSRLVEVVLLERQFRRVWAAGWRRLRRQAGGGERTEVGR
jgi:hypothetical protein